MRALQFSLPSVIMLMCIALVRAFDVEGSGGLLLGWLGGSISTLVWFYLDERGEA